VSTAIARSNPTAKFTVISGPMKGAIRLSRGTEIVLGRSPECDFVLVNDPRVSRRHAQVLLSRGGYELNGLNERNPVLVNGREVSHAALNDGDLLTIGSTEIRFNLAFGRDAGGGDVALAEHGGLATPDYQAPAANYTQSTRSRATSRPAPAAGFKIPTRFVIYGVVAILGYWIFFTGGGVLKKKEVKLRTEEQIASDIKTANALRDVAEAGEDRKMDLSLAMRQAQENYVRGFRDFRKGQYERAQISLQACLALNPEHVLCNRYLRLTQRKFDELVQYQIVLGRKYRDQNQYGQCRSSFRNVMVMVKDPGNRVFQEAKANYEACDALAEGHY
jgi:hypothetical protein